MVDKVEKIKNHSKRGRPVLLNDVLKQAIILYKSSNPDWSAKKILESIKAGYFIKLRKAHPDWSDTKIREQSNFPGLNRVQRYLKEISPQLSQKSPLQEKWHLGTLREYPITPEAVKKIFELKARGKDYISIRIARWISSLSALPLPIDMLYLSAMEYSTAEEIAEISRTELNTTNMDMMLLEHMKNSEITRNGSKKADETPIKIEAVPAKNDIVLTKNEAVPVKNNTTPVKNDTLPLKTEAAPIKNEAVLAKNNVPVEKNNVAEPKVETPVVQNKPKGVNRNWRMPDIRERQSSIAEFLKFVEKQKDID